MANGLASGLERGLSGVASGIRTKRKSAQEEEARQRAAAFLSAYAQGGGQMPQNNGGLADFLGIPGALSYLEPNGSATQAGIKTAGRDNMYWDGKQWVPVDPNYVEQPKSASDGQPDYLTKLITARDRLPANHPDRPIYEQAIKKYAEGVQTYSPVATASGEIVPFATRSGQFQEPTGQFKPPSAEVKTQKVSLEDAILNAREVGTLFNKALVGPAAGNLGKLKSMVANNPEFQRLRTTVARLRAIIYGLSGKQINESEQAWLQNEILPSLTNPDENFQTNLETFKEWADRRLGLLEDEFHLKRNKKLNEAKQEDGTSNLSEEDKQAIEWAKANRGTPESDAILKLHGIQ